MPPCRKSNFSSIVINHVHNNKHVTDGENADDEEDSHSYVRDTRLPPMRGKPRNAPTTVIEEF